MIWRDWNEFWAMGGYATYVWGSYAVCFAALAVELALARARHKKALMAASDAADFQEAP